MLFEKEILKHRSSAKSKKFKYILKLHFYVCFFIVIILSANNSFSQNEISINLFEPPPGYLNSADVWKFTLINNTGDSLRIYLKGSATEETDGLIVTGETETIFLNPHQVKFMKVTDLSKTPDITYHTNIPRYKNSLENKGAFPDGVYKICVEAYSADRIKKLGSDCMDVDNKKGIFSLIMPDDDTELNMDQSLIFSWTPFRSAGIYSLKIVEIIKGQSSEDAILKNKIFFEVLNLPRNTFIYPLTEKRFDSTKTYAWQVTENGSKTKSEVWSFRIKKDTPVKDPEIKIPSTVKLKAYYELDEEPVNEFVMITNDTLNLQFINNYASADKMTFSIFDDTKALVVKDSLSTFSEYFVNGLSRVSISLKKLRLKPDKLYSLILYCYKKNLYLNFKIKAKT